MSDFTREDLLRQIRMTTAATLLSPPPPPPPPSQNPNSDMGSPMMEVLRAALMRRRAAAAASTRAAAAGGTGSLLDEIRNFNRDGGLSPASSSGTPSHTMSLREQLEQLMIHAHPDSDTYPDTESFSSDW